MAANLLDTLQDFLTPEMIQNASTFLDERPSGIQKGIEGAVPTLLGGLIERSTTPGGAETLLNVINRVGQGVDLGELARGGGSLDDLVRSGKDVLGTIFGGKLGAVVDGVSTASGLRQTSTSSLLAMLAPIVLGVLGRETSSKGLGAAGLVSLLAGQRADVTRFLPAGLSSTFASVTGLVKEDPGLVAAIAAQASGVTSATAGAAANTADDLADTVARRAATFGDTAASVVRGRESAERGTAAPVSDVGMAHEPSAGRRWLLPLVVLALLAFAIWWLLLRDRSADERLAQAAEPTAASSPAASPGSSSGAGAPSAASPSAAGSSASPSASGGSSPAGSAAGSSPASPGSAGAASASGAAAAPAAGGGSGASGTTASSDRSPLARAGAAAADAGRTAADAGAAVGRGVGAATAKVGEKAADAGRAVGREAREVAGAAGEAGKAVGRDARDAAAKAGEATAAAGKTAARETKAAAAEVGSDAARAGSAVGRETASIAAKTGRATEEGAKAAAHEVGTVASKIGHAVGIGSGGTASVTLPGGTSLEVPERSATHELARYLEGGSAGDVPRTFVFDRLHFQSGSTRLTRESQQTVAQLAAILKAYPSVAVRLDGYTDSRGPEAHNKALSQHRATALKAMLEGDGVAASQLTVAGLGEDKPIASNGTFDGRKKNRRIEIVVTKR